MAIFLPSLVKSCWGGHGISSKQQRGSALPTPREKRRMTMATFLLSSVKSCERGHGISSKEEEVCSSYSQEEGSDNHGHLPPFLSEEL